MIQIRPDSGYYQVVVKATPRHKPILYSNLLSRDKAEDKAKSLVKIFGLKGKAAKIHYA